MAPARFRTLVPRAAGALLAIALTTAPAWHARADGLADEADLHFQLGAEEFRNGNYRGALEHFLLSNRLVPNRNVVFNIARMYELLQRFPDAHRYYVDALQGETNQQVVHDINEALARISPRVAVLRIDTTPPGATVYLNRRDLGSRGTTPRPLAVEPGTYRVIIERDGYEPIEQDGVTARTGNETHLQLSLRAIVGTVRVEGDAAGAEVHVDDEHAAASCTAPCAVDLPPGPHLLYLTQAGHQVLTRQVNVVAHEDLMIRDGLRPLTGSVVVDADERGALVEIGSRTVGFTPAVASDVAVGRQHLRVSMRGYAPIERDIDVHANEQVRVTDLRLLPLREVTAVSRVAESIDDAPSSLSIIDGQELRAFAYPTVAESLRGIRGVYLSNDRSYWSAGVRGIGEPNDYGNRVLVLQDGANLNDNLLNSSYIGSDQRPDLHDLERIEIIRGPGSLLYGSNAFSGVINLVTRDREEPTSVHGGFGTYDNAVAHARLGFNWHASNNAGVWASVSGARSDGYDSVIPLRTDTGGTQSQTANRVDAFWNSGSAGRAWYGPLTAQWYFNTRQQYIPVGAYGTVFNDPRTNFTDTRYMGEVRFEPKLSENVQLLTRFHANRYTFHGEYAYAPFPGGVNVENYAGTWFGLESRLVITPLRGVRITAGVEGQLHTEATLEGFNPDLDPKLPARTPSQLQDQTQYLSVHNPYAFAAGYALLDADIFPWLRISAGARVDVYSTFGAIFVPRGAVILKPVHGGVLKIMGGRAFRAPSVYESYYNDGGISQFSASYYQNQTGAFLTLGPESIYSLEVEYSQRFLEDWVALGAVHGSFVQSLVETIDAGTGIEGTPAVRYANQANATVVYGVEGEIRREWRQGWMLSAMYGYQHVQVQDGTPYYPPANNAMAATSRFVNVPEHLASFRAVAPIVPGLASAALRVAIESDRRIDRVTNDVTEPVSVITDLVLSGATHVSRVGIRYAVGVYNLFDWHYSVPVTDTFLSRTMPQNGRTFLVDLTATF